MQLPAQLICVIVYAYADCSFSYAAAHGVLGRGTKFPAKIKKRKKKKWLVYFVYVGVR